MDPATPLARRPLVLDTNVVLDVFVFQDAGVAPLRRALNAGLVHWIATAAMRVELTRVLTYPRIVPQLVSRDVRGDDVLAAFDRHSALVEPAAPCGVACADPDDQPFVDLAVAHRALLLSKDHAVLATAKRLAPLGAQVARAMPAQGMPLAVATTVTQSPA